MLELIKHKDFTNGSVFAIRTEDGFLLEVTDTFLPIYTKDCINGHTNKLQSASIGDRSERWIIGVSCMSGCPVRCKFCATGNMKGYRNLTAEEIVAQVEFVINQESNLDYGWTAAKEHKINYTRMGEPFLNIEEVKKAIAIIDERYPGTHHYISTIGIKGADYSWIKDNITLQVSVHSLIDDKRNNLIPFKNKVTIEELGQIRTKSNLKTTINMTLVDEEDFDIVALKKYFDKDYFFVKISPINVNAVSEANNMGTGVIKGINLI